MRTEEVVKQLATVFVGVEAVIDVGLEAGVYVAVVKFAVED